MNFFQRIALAMYSKDKRTVMNIQQVYSTTSFEKQFIEYFCDGKFKYFFVVSL